MHLHYPSRTVLDLLEPSLIFNNIQSISSTITTHHQLASTIMDHIIPLSFITDLLGSSRTIIATKIMAIYYCTWNTALLFKYSLLPAWELDGRQPLWKTISMQVNLNWRQPQVKNCLNVRQPQCQTTISSEDYLNGRRPQWKPTSMKTTFILDNC